MSLESDSSKPPGFNPGSSPEGAPDSKTRPPPFPVVAVGASAGGLGAFRKLLEHLPPDTGMAYVLIPHLDPSHHSIMSEILSRTTKMPVKEARDGLPVEPDHAYVISPNTIMTVEEEKLHLVPRNASPGRKHECIDHFMVSLAQQYREKAIGVVLSGTAADGSFGIETIKAEGGITFAQDQSAEFADMPRNAIATGCVDLVLPPEGIAEELSKISRHPYLRKSAPASLSAPGSQLEPSNPDQERILRLLRSATGVDFEQYKQTTIERRIARRMALRKVEDISGYLRFLESNPPEVRALYDELLINVTSFFREPEAFEVLKQQVFPELIHGRLAGDPLRIWVPGCSTGEETYSLAIALVEFLQEENRPCDIQIFGSDVSERSLEKARSGSYDAGIRAEVSPERLARFFTTGEGGSLRISKAVRDLCVFARQDVTRDPPFSRLDLLSCRNMLIYLGPALQKRVIPLFHYALKPKGFLFLGSSESVDSYPQLFGVVDKKSKVFRRLPGAAQDLPFPSGERVFPKSNRTFPNEIPPPATDFDVSKATDRFLLAHHVPAVIVFNQEDRVLEVRGNTEPFLRISPGRLSSSVQKIVREELIVELDRTIRHARQSGLAARSAPVRLNVLGSERQVEIEAAPLPGPAGPERYVIAIFREEGGPRPAAESLPAPSGDQDGPQENTRLRAEIEGLREYQQTVVEKYDAAIEELRSAGEETLSANEELQSTNEELETSKEEIQSANEELTTLNDELQHRNVELGELNSDLGNVILGANVALVILDTGLRLRRFTPQAEKLLHLVAGDVGRPIGDFKAALEIHDLEKLVLGVIEHLAPVEQEFQDALGRWYSMRIRPYRNTENRIEGAVLIFSDIDEIRRSMIALELAHAVTEGIVETIRTPLLILDGHLRVTRGNRAFYTTFQTLPEATEGRAVYELGNRQWDIPKLRTLLEDILPKATHFEEMEIIHSFPQIGQRIMHLHGRQITLKEGDSPKNILLAIEDVTIRKDADAEIRRLNAGLERRVKERTSELEGAWGEMQAFTYSVAHDLRAPLRTMGGFAQALLDDYVDRPLDAEGKDFARRIITSSHRMDTLIQDLLAYSQLAREQVSIEPVDLGALLDTVLLDMGAEIQERKAVITVDKPVLGLRAHRSSLQQVLTNLLSNAIKFVAPGVLPRVRIWTEARASRIRVWVEDNGIGIEEKYQERIFRVFERIHPPEAYPGTGIGLAIVRRAIERVGGSTGVESGKGRGSRFWIELNGLREVP